MALDKNSQKLPEAKAAWQLGLLLTQPFAVFGREAIRWTNQLGASAVFLFLALLAAGLLCGAAHVSTAHAAPTQEKWIGRIDLHQGDTGTIELTRTDSMISGRMVINRGGTQIETAIQGEWAANSIVFSRSLSATSVQPFRGVVTVVDARHASVEGQFAAGFSGRWTGEFGLVGEPTELRRDPPPVKDAHPAPAGTTSRTPPRVKKAAPATVEPIKERRPFTPLASPGLLLAAWIEPTLVSTDQAPTFASFVGGAIGSGRKGQQLLNAWGGKSGQLYGNVTLYLLFANIDRAYSVKIESFQGGNSTGTSDLGMTQAGQNEMWVPLSRTIQGECRERIIFNGTYVGDIRYTISKSGE